MPRVFATMTPPLRLAALCFAFSCTVLPSHAQTGDAEYKPELFQSLKLVYSDNFDGPLNTEFWEVRQSSTWIIQDGVLSGSQSSKEFQEKMIAKGDRAHAGFKPVIWLKQVPENFVCAMRMRYNAEDYHPKFPLIDLGHHIHTLTFGRAQTTLTLGKTSGPLVISEPLLPLNEWADIVIELKKGAILLQINGKKHRFESAQIDMTGHAQIDFKGVDFGSCQIDHIRLWKGE